MVPQWLLLLLVLMIVSGFARDVGVRPGRLLHILVLMVVSVAHDSVLVGQLLFLDGLD